MGWRGPRLPGWLHRLLGGAVDPTGILLPRARLLRYGHYVALQFTHRQTQSRMRAAEPGHLLVDYTRTMLAALLWRPRPRRIGVIGLGGGSQVKFCHAQLPGACIEAVENHPGVLALRHEFAIPDDDARLAVVLDDGARFVAARRGAFDLLLLDGYDASGIPQALSTQAFHDGCRAALAPRGVLAANLFCGDADRHVAQLRRAFGEDRVLVVGEARMSNRVAFCWTGDAPVTHAACGRAMHAMAPGVRVALGAELDRVANALACGIAQPGGLDRNQGRVAAVADRSTRRWRQ